MSIEQKQEVINIWKTNPVAFHLSLFDTDLWKKQVDVFLSVRDNKRTAVKSGNTVGKSHIAASIVHWYLNTHYPSKVITTAPTWTQVEDILWKEIGNLHYKMRHKINRGALLKTQLQMNEEHFAIGLSTDDRQRFQGFHSPHLLVVVDEAGGVSSDIWEAIEGLHPDKVLAIGNPLDPMGDFYNCFQSSLWNKITISCEDCVKWQKENHAIPGLVTNDWIQERRTEWGEKSALYQARVLGEFPEETADTLIQRKWVDDARRRDLKEDEEDTTRVVSCDVATKHGTNETVTSFRYGHTIKELKGYHQIPTTKIADILQWDYSRTRSTSVVVDSDGVGEGVSDMLVTRRIPTMEFHGGYGQKAIDVTRFRNLRTQFYWIVAKKFEKGLYDLTRIPQKEYELLKNQLCSIKTKPLDAQGRMQIETKEDLMARQIKSPDYADCFMMGEYGFWMGNMAELRPYKW